MADLKQKIRMQQFKQRLKERIRVSNEAEKKGMLADPWVIEYRIKNNQCKANWKAQQPKKEFTPKANSGSFKKGFIPHHKMTDPILIEKSKEYRKEYRKKWRKDNAEHLKKYRRDRRQNDVNFRIKSNLRKRLSTLLRKSIVNKTEQTMYLLGCSIEELKNHLQQLFTEGMSFDNYGEWHIDHKIPCDSFDLAKEDDRIKCFHFSNLQPLWAIDNLKKSNKIIKNKV